MLFMHDVFFINETLSLLYVMQDDAKKVVD